MADIRRIGVVTVTYNSAKVLAEFLDCVFSQSFHDFILYVVDNASTDISVEMASSYPDRRIRIIANDENLGVAEGNNQGIRSALANGCDAVLLLNNDTVFPDETFAQLIDGLEKYQCAMTTPKIYYHDKPNKIWAAGGYFQPWFGYRTQHYGEGQQDRGQFDTIRTITYAPTCCVLIDKEVFNRIGLMDPLYFVYVDDVDFMYRVLKAGYVIKYLPHCKLWHKVSSLTGGAETSFLVLYSTRNRAYFLRKHLTRLLAVLWYGAYHVHYALDCLLKNGSHERWRLRRISANDGWKMQHAKPR